MTGTSRLLLIIAQNANALVTQTKRHRLVNLLFTNDSSNTEHKEHILLTK